ncbi:hypothetical protein NDU88_004412 [Pleurodeles waltl]|uniref:Uncharacterized protein n=1 Tax=Pleurodeles waltl TaxID=8319 RepID=A0AAV7V165_PLEWA|nr:hypothetical protein NDU88_004412 [Pleurodeles waltl]
MCLKPFCWDWSLRRSEETYCKFVLMAPQLAKRHTGMKWLSAGPPKYDDWLRDMSEWAKAEELRMKRVMDSRLVLRRLHLGRRQVPVGAKEGNLWMTMTEELPTWVAADLKNVCAGDATVAGDPTGSRKWGVLQNPTSLCPPHVCSMFINERAVVDSRLVLRRLHLGRRQVPVGAKEGNLWMTMTESFQPGRVADDLKNVSAGDATVAGDPTAAGEGLLRFLDLISSPSAASLKAKCGTQNDLQPEGCGDLKNVSAGDASVAGDPIVPCQLCVLHHPRKDTFLLSCGSTGILGRKDTGKSLDFLLFHM